MSRLVWAGVLAALALLALAVVSLGADATVAPSAVPGEVLAGGDLRSEGEGPGLVGSPLLILFAVVCLGLATAAVTALLLRFIDHDRS